ncbi:multiprotein-bridging factor 1 family protein [Paraperlucidibaca wandonensis]|uniref:Multiprotein-bridging factor 1 family protein n=1 Tax=Paraperlucidibaca wandonensis TaxID=1268273 RepID=A0ABW3HGP8_9GAMM
MTPVNEEDSKTQKIARELFFSLPERVRSIREGVKMTREQFAESTGVNIHTIKALEQKGVMPGGEVLTKIAQAFPEHALWLISGKVQKIGGHLMPENAKASDQVAMTIINRFDPRSPEECAVKIKALSAKAIFITDKKAIDVACAIPVRTRHGETEDVVWADYGSISLKSEKPSMETSLFIAWLKDIGIERFELKCIIGELDKAESGRVIWESQICDEAAIEGKEFLEAKASLNRWTK